MRLFTGISIPPDLIDALASAVEELRAVADLNWSRLENLHITTKFIGEWPEDRLPEMKAALHATPTPLPFEISIERFGFFPNPHRPHTFFTGVHAGPELKTLAAGLDVAMQGLGLEPEKRDYSPHLTLAKIRNQSVQGLREYIAKKGPPVFGKFAATEFHLYLSKPSGGRSEYSILETYPLSGPLLSGSLERKEAIGE